MINKKVDLFYSPKRFKIEIKTQTNIQINSEDNITPNIKQSINTKHELDFKSKPK